MENFIQCTLEAVGDKLKGSTLVVGGDGRYGMKLAVDNIIKIAAANKVGHGNGYSKQKDSSGSGKA
jgi:phosphoglucomutase